MSTQITVEVQIESPLDKVWELWTHSSHITSWYFASDEWCCPHAKIDLRPSGTFNYRMEAKDGSMGFDFIGVFDRVVQNERIDYSLEDGRKVETHFTIDGGATRVRQTFDPENTNSTEMQKAGWQAILNCFKNYVETQ